MGCGWCPLIPDVKRNLLGVVAVAACWTNSHGPVKCLVLQVAGRQAVSGNGIAFEILIGALEPGVPRGQVVRARAKALDVVPGFMSVQIRKRGLLRLQRTRPLAFEIALVKTEAPLHRDHRAGGIDHRAHGHDTADIQPGAKPDLDTDEAGLWMYMDKAEADLKPSGRIVTDERLTNYIGDIICRLDSHQCEHMRFYIV